MMEILIIFTSQATVPRAEPYEMIAVAAQTPREEKIVGKNALTLTHIIRGIRINSIQLG